MPKKAQSGVRGLYKKHSLACPHRGELGKCDCPWYAKYKGQTVNLARWSNQYVDPRRKQHATVILNRLRTAIDADVFRPDGEYEVATGNQPLRAFIAEWKEHYAKA